MNTFDFRSVAVVGIVSVVGTGVIDGIVAIASGVIGIVAEERIVAVVGIVTIVTIVEAV